MGGRFRKQKATMEELAELYREATLQIVAQGLLHDYVKTFEQITRYHYNLAGCLKAANFLTNIGHEERKKEYSPELRKLARNLLARSVLSRITALIDNNSESHLWHDHFSTPDSDCILLKPIMLFFRVNGNCDLAGRDLQEVRNFVKALTLHIKILTQNSIQLEDLTKLVIATSAWEAMPLAGIPAPYNHLRNFYLRRGANLQIEEPPKDPGAMEWPFWEKFLGRSISCTICDKCHKIFYELGAVKHISSYKQDEQKIALLLLNISTHNHTSVIGKAPAKKLLELMHEMVSCKLTWEQPLKK